MTRNGATLRAYVPREVIEHIDHLAERNGLSQSSQTRMLLLDALRASVDHDDEDDR